jgi:hypothetical protein
MPIRILFFLVDESDQRTEAFPNNNVSSYTGTLFFSSHAGLTEQATENMVCSFFLKKILVEMEGMKASYGMVSTISVGARQINRLYTKEQAPS